MAIFEALADCRMTVSQFLLAPLTHQHYDKHPVTKDILLHSTDIIGTILVHPMRNPNIIQHLTKLAKNSYLKEICDVASMQGGWNFGVSTATTKQLDDFGLDDMACDFKAHAPGFGGFIGALLGQMQRGLLKQD
ncbi:hypothetical protein PAXRUDRAFT_145328 [Paxillus rubicundulus Ve08.2h10]|uniref:Uncharacterized protein n=1 Tax=Paxillus rubicundulus Ve08.2h10 TaxID=930991 RepID=A0A0D0DNC2_9AGAM|nr:hypothetical protein PAXRUDRAFT_145328 [Paxillus rubicundulus Ve08.2h10]